MFTNLYGVRLNLLMVGFYKPNHVEKCIEFYSVLGSENGEQKPFYALYYDDEIELEAELARIDSMVCRVRADESRPMMDEKFNTVTKLRKDKKLRLS